MKKDENECYNKLFEKISSIETTIKTIKENLAVLKDIFNENPQRKENAHTILNSEESTNDRGT
jgi:hypothetical protein